MSWEKALSVLTRLYDFVNHSDCYPFDEESVEALRMALMAVERQIERRPLPEPKVYGNGICAGCGAYFLDKSTNYCGNCGQALNWHDEER